MNIAPYLNFDGTCAEAMAFYAQVFQGTIVHQSTFGEMPPDPNMPPLPESAMGRIMHAHLQFGHNNIMASDSFPSIPGMDEQACVGGYQKPQGLWVSMVWTAPQKANGYLMPWLKVAPSPCLMPQLFG